METTTVNKPKSPDQVSESKLRKLEKRYSNPKNSMEAFILYAIHAAMHRREIERTDKYHHVGDDIYADSVEDEDHGMIQSFEEAIS